MRPILATALILINLVFSNLAFSLSTSMQNSQFKGLDKNGDGVITRKEWKGNDRSFQIHDWNHDGIISGEELGNDEEIVTSEEVYLNRFDTWDINNDGQISRSEWKGSNEQFNRLDKNRNGYLDSVEFYSRKEIKQDPFAVQDLNQDGYISQAEWKGSMESWNRLNTNRDSFLTREEYFQIKPKDRFTQLDINQDSIISKSEWKGSSKTFTNFDKDKNGVITRKEYSENRDAIFQELDINQDSVLTRLEWKGDKSDFDQMDLNQDEIISKREFLSYKKPTKFEKILDGIFGTP